MEPKELVVRKVAAAQKYLKMIHRRKIKSFVKESKYSGCWSVFKPCLQQTGA
jgi:hypothetical protein